MSLEFISCTEWPSISGFGAIVSWRAAGLAASANQASRNVQQGARILRRNQQQRSGCARRGAPPLLPLLERPDGNAEQRSELQLRKAGLLADTRYRRHTGRATVLATLDLTNTIEDLPPDVPLSLRHRSPP